MNSIAAQIADFLKEYAPFNHLTIEELSEIANSIRVVNLEKRKSLFQINDSLHDVFYVVASGVINLSIIADADEALLNKCYQGDIFGLRPFFAKNKYAMTAKAREDSIVYAIPITIFKPFVGKNPEVLDFILENFAKSANTHSIKQSSSIVDSAHFSDQQSEVQFFQNLNYNTAPIIATTTDLVNDVAQLMAENRNNGVIVCENHIPVGILTNTDLSYKIATGRFPLNTAVFKVMSSPVMTVIENVSLAEAQLMMLKNNVTHLCVTEDGTDKSKVKGIISEHDLIVSQASNPGVLIKEIKRSLSAIELKQIREHLSELIQNSINKNIPLTHIFNIANEINFAILKRAVEISILDLGSPPARFAWLSIGSQGRKEQLLLTDQDNILIFEDVSEVKYRDVKDYFIKLSKRATAILEKVGYEFCPNGHVAHNLQWCKSLSDWTKQFRNWIDSPGEKDNGLSSIFFDYELVFGDPKIEEAINNVVYKDMTKNILFFDFLGNDALKRNAPLTFFKNFNIEEEGPNKEKFDIKTKAIMPLVDSARMLALSHDIKGINNTYSRFKQVATLDPKNADIYIECAEAFLKLSKIKTLEGLKNDTSGQYIDLKELNKIDKEKLKNAFTPMRELEDLIKSKFKLTHFS